MTDLKKRQSELAFMAYQNGIISQAQYTALLITPASHNLCEMILDVSAGMIDADDSLSRIVREAPARLGA
jgi:hypothetical protein